VSKNFWRQTGECTLNRERLESLADYLDKISTSSWDYHVFAQYDKHGRFIKGDALGHASQIWPDAIDVSADRVISVACEFFDIPLFMYLKLFGVQHAIDHFGTEEITSQLVASKIRKLLYGKDEKG